MNLNKEICTAVSSLFQSFLFIHIYIFTVFNSTSFQDNQTRTSKKEEFVNLRLHSLTYPHTTEQMHHSFTCSCHKFYTPTHTTMHKHPKNANTHTRSPKCCTNKSVDSANRKPNNKTRNISNTHSLKNKHPHKFTPLRVKKKSLWNVIKQHLLHHLCSVRVGEGWWWWGH